VLAFTFHFLEDVDPAQVPESYTLDEACTMPLAFWTAALGLYVHLPLPLPPPTVRAHAFSTVSPVGGGGEPLLVWGGASSVGSMAIQLATLSGFRVVATASRGNWEYVRKCGAEWVVDYHEINVRIFPRHELAWERH
jgi:NADPH:quinone reductase-like Zn-dependent oxidoreductase